MVQKVISFFVIFLFCGVLVAQNQNENEEFLNAQFLILDEVQPLTRAERESMESIFHAEFAVLGFRDIAFNIAMSRTLENLEYYIHYYKEEIAKRAYLLYNEEESRYRQKMGISDYSLETIKPKLKEQSEAIALYEARTFGYPDILSHIKEDVYLTYEKEISDVYIRNDAVGLSYNLGLVLQNKEQLNLDAAQVDSIVAAAFEIKLLIADGEITEIENNCWLFEREFIMQTLTEEQVGEFAVIRYTNDAKNYAIKTWEEGKSYQMEIQDSIMI